MLFLLQHKRCINAERNNEPEYLVIFPELDRLKNSNYFGREKHLMIALLFILVVIGISVFINTNFADTVTWTDYYRGVFIGLFVSAIILRIWNKRRKNKEEKNQKSLYDKSE